MSRTIMSTVRGRVGRAPGVGSRVRAVAMVAVTLIPFSWVTIATPARVSVVVGAIKALTSAPITLVTLREYNQKEKKKKVMLLQSSNITLIIPW